MEFTIHIVIAAIAFIISTIVFFTTNKDARKKTKKILLFTFLFALVITACGALGHFPVAGTMTVFIGLQILFLGMGYIQFILLKKQFYGDLQKEDLSKVMLVLMNVSVGIIGFTVVFNYTSTYDVAPFYSLTAITFVLPQFAATAFEKYIAIPEEIYQIWYFPVNEDEIDFEHIDTSTVYMLELEYSKSVSDNRLLNSKVRAPLGMKFGDWFRSFIENYNERYDSDPIHYLNNDNTPIGWIFYVKPSFLGTARYIDPDLTITGNKLTEKNKIIAKRVGIAI